MISDSVGDQDQIQPKILMDFLPYLISEGVIPLDSSVHQSALMSPCTHVTIYAFTCALIN